MCLVQSRGDHPETSVPVGILGGESDSPASSLSQSNRLTFIRRKGTAACTAHVAVRHGCFARLGWRDEMG